MVKKRVLFLNSNQNLFLKWAHWLLYFFKLEKGFRINSSIFWESAMYCLPITCFCVKCSCAKLSNNLSLSHMKTLEWAVKYFLIPIASRYLETLEWACKGICLPNWSWARIYIHPGTKCGQCPHRVPCWHDCQAEQGSASDRWTRYSQDSYDQQLHKALQPWIPPGWVCQLLFSHHTSDVSSEQTIL